MKDFLMKKTNTRSSNSILYVEAIMEKQEYLERAEDFYQNKEQKDPLDLLREYADEIEVSFPEVIESREAEKIRRQDDLGYQHFEEALDFIALEHFLEDEQDD